MTTESYIYTALLSGAVSDSGYRLLIVQRVLAKLSELLIIG